MIYIEKVGWAIATVFLLSSGLYFTFKLKGVQFRFKDMFKSFNESNDDIGVTPFESLAISLGGRIGVGNLAGIALAINYGGPGTIFWLCLSTVLCSTNAFSESVLGVLYRKKDNKEYIGGPSYYINYGIKKRGLGLTYAVLLIFTYIGGFLSVQSNTIVKSIEQVYKIDPKSISIGIAILTIIIIFKGLRGVAFFSAKVVPIMTVGYILICFYILILNVEFIPQIIKTIFTEAFNPTSATLGIFTPIIIGVQRGIFSNESGIGTGAIASATANTDSPSKQGFIQTLSIYVETLVVCSLTAFVILLSNYDQTSWYNINGIEITQFAFNYHLGNIGIYVVMSSIFLFAFSSIITGYYYGEANLRFLFKRVSKSGIAVFRILVALILFIGGIASPKIIWSVADILIVFLAIINVYAIISLKDDVIKEYKSYRSKNK